MPPGPPAMCTMAGMTELAAKQQRCSGRRPTHVLPGQLLRSSADYALQSKIGDGRAHVAAAC